MMILMIGTTELLLVGGLALLLFGGKKLPEMMRGLGQGVREFKKGVNDINPDLDSSVVSENSKNSESSETSETPGSPQQ